MGKSIFLLALLIFSNCFSQIVFPSQDRKTLQYGLKSSDGSWVVKPEFRSVQNFYDHGIKRDSVGIFQKDEYYKRSNIVVKSSYGLFSEKGKNLIPVIYKSLYCTKGICMAGTHDKKTVILNYKNEKLAELEGIPQKLKDSIVLFYSLKYNAHYFFSLRNSKINGPFSTISFTDKNLLFAETFSRQKAFYKEDGSVYLRNDSIYDSKPELYPYDLFLIKNQKGVTFSDRNGKLYETYYQNVDPWQMTYCNKPVSHGDYTTCKDGGTIDIKKVVEYYGFDPSVLYITKEKELEYSILSTFSVDDLNNENFENYQIVQYKNPENPAKRYAVLDKDRVVLNSEFPILKFFIDTALTQNPENSKYYIVKKDKTVEVNEKHLNELKSFGSVNFNISFNSKNNVIKVYNELSTKLFIVNEKGNIKEIKGKDITNFYNGFAYLNDGNKMFLINENLERLKQINNGNNSTLGSFKDFDSNGILIWSSYKNIPGQQDKEFYGALHYKGEKIIPESDNKIYKENPIFYISYSETEKDEEGNQKNFAFNKNGKKIDPKDKVNGIYFSYYPNYLIIHYDYVSYYYYYSGEYLGNDKDGLDWEADKLEKLRF
ncbi:hypothetical protein FY557_06140 [Chryseobacterium sp. SN22]|uniref:hypothetical protein n=1 Tax=Chryseobacterium sp. SN22 TaxID=2606431 RepID=UPI0011ED4321|nr:hypothetical protein [Chryseobacterium sp. SN22]KAA0129142.1 hypothetical protein FY557_06140 [Chryseobacterium sp. SN22]